MIVMPSFEVYLIVEWEEGTYGHNSQPAGHG